MARKIKRKPKARAKGKTCGDFGGVRRDGEPCNRARAEYPCPGHEPGGKVTNPLQLNARAVQDAFLEAIVELNGNISASAERVGMDRQTHYDWQREDATYPERYAAAQSRARDKLREVIRSRAIEGVEEPFKVVPNPKAGTEGEEPYLILKKRVFSDRLLLSLASAHLEEHRPRMDVRVIERELEGMTVEELLAEVRGLQQRLDPQTAADLAGEEE